MITLTVGRGGGLEAGSGGGKDPGIGGFAAGKGGKPLFGKDL